VNNDRVKFEVLTPLEEHPVSDHGLDCFGFQTTKKAVRQFSGSQDVIVSPDLFFFHIKPDDRLGEMSPK